MKHFVGVAVLSLALLGPGPVRAENAQQQKMKDCSAQASAKHLKGSDRQSFMAQCLKTDGGAQLNAQQQKMKDCNAQATQQHLTGQPRKTFMSDCLSGKAQN